MDSSNRLVKQELIDKATESIGVLSKNIEDLATVNTGICDAISDNLITGSLGEGITEHLLSLVNLNSSFSCLLQMDIQDYNELINILNSNITDSKDYDLDGTTINNGISSCESDIAFEQAVLDSIDQDYSRLSAPEQILLGASYQISRGIAISHINGYQRELEEFQRQADLFDTVQDATSDLFVENSDLRAVIEDGYTQLPTEWHGNACQPARIPAIAAAWKYNLESINEQIIQRYVDDIYTVNSDGSLNINWDNVDEIFQSDPAEVNPYQYMALAYLYSNMSDEDMNKVFEHANLTEDNNYHTVSESFGTSLTYYNYLTTSSVDPSSWNNNRDVLRSTAMATAYDYLAHNNGNGDAFAVGFIPNYMDDNVVQSYTVNITFSDDPTELEQFIQALSFNSAFNSQDPESMYYYSVQQAGEEMARMGKYVTFTVNRCTSSNGFDYDADSIAVAYIDRIGGNWGSFAVDQAGHIGFGAISSLPYISEIPGISIPFTIAALTYDAAKQRETRNDANAAIDTITFGNMFTAVSAGGSLIVGDYNMFALGRSDSVTVTNVNVNEQILSARVDAYNAAHPGAEISIGDVINGFNQAVSGETDLSALDFSNSMPSDADAFVRFYRDYYSHPERYEGI